MAKITVGRIINTHALKGEVKVESHSDFDEERYLVGNRVFLENEQESIPVVVASFRMHKGFPLVSFEGYQDINLIEKYKNYYIRIEEEDREPLPEGRYYIDELIGLICEDEEGNEIGEVIDVEPTNGAQNNLRILREDDTTVLVPYVPAFIKDVDLEEGIIVIHVIAGLL